MTTEQGFRFVTRALTIYSLFWFVDLTFYLPVDIIGVTHHLRLLGLARETGRSINDEVYWVRYYMEIGVFKAIFAILSGWLSVSFYRGSGWLRKFLLIETEAPSAE
jgi:hypothetical protein